MTHHRRRTATALATALALGACATPSGHMEPYRDVSCLGMADVSLTEAIEAAERARGARVIDAEYNMETEMGCLGGDPGHFDIVFFRNGSLTKGIVEADSGVVGPGHEETFLARLLDLDFISDWPESEMRRGGGVATQAAITLSMAVSLAERTGGMPLAAHVKTDGGRTRYAVELVDRSGLRMVFVDLEGRVSSQ